MSRLIVNAFCANTVSHVFHGLWRHPDNRQVDFNSADFWVEFAQIAESGYLDSIFWADCIGLGSGYQGNWDLMFREGVMVPTNDPSTLVPVLARETESIGFVFTSSIVQEHPFNFARRLSTLDHLTNGRIGWNVVTPSIQGVAGNFGLPGIPKHEARYAWADEYLEVTGKLWEASWEDTAVVRDRVSGVFADPARIHKIDHVGDHYNVVGPHLVEPSPQRTPLLFQAGASKSGREFAAKHAEGIFLASASPAAAAEIITDIKARALTYGRNPEEIKFLQVFSFVVGSTEEEAERKSSEIDSYLSIDGLLAHMSRDINIDFGQVSPNEPLSSLTTTDSFQGILDAVRATVEPGREPTVADFAYHHAHHTRIVGTPEKIANEIERWVAAGVGGINIFQTIAPQSLRDFVDHVVPELQRRGLMQHAYTPGTLRNQIMGYGDRLPAEHPTAFRTSALTR